MMRYLKANVKAKTKKRTDAEVPIFRMPRRCEVLVDSSDREVLHSTGIDVIQGLWYASPANEFLDCNHFVRNLLEGVCCWFYLRNVSSKSIANLAELE